MKYETHIYNWVEIVALSDKKNKKDTTFTSGKGNIILRLEENQEYFIYLDSRVYKPKKIKINKLDSKFNDIGEIVIDYIDDKPKPKIKKRKRKQIKEQTQQQNQRIDTTPKIIPVEVIIPTENIDETEAELVELQDSNAELVKPERIKL